MKTYGFAILFASVACSSDPAGSSSPDGGTPVVDAGGDGRTITADSGSPIVDGGSDAGSCSAAKEQLLKPIASVSTGEVTVLGDASGVKTFFVDGSAGGTMAQATTPRVYVNLETTTRVAVTDTTAETSFDWDLSIKRPVLFTNSGDGGRGQGGAVFLPGIAFDGVTAADASGKTFAKEAFLDSECNAQLDAMGAVRTSFEGWYDYNQANNQLTPKSGTWLVRGGTGKLFKLEIGTYYATPDGGTGMAGGRYTFRVKAL